VSKFHDDVLALDVPQVDKSILNKPSTLHLTVGMLGLYREDDVKEAVQLLQKLSGEINAMVDKQVVMARLPGLAIMESDSTAAHVMYAKVEEHSVLVRLAAILRSRFEEAGYLKRGTLKYHATLINTSYRNAYKSFSANRKGRQRRDNKRIPFNAGRILDNFRHIDFGTCRIDTIALSRVGDRDANGDYIHEGYIKLGNEL
jgi:2'-5' RNA ligase